MTFVSIKMFMTNWQPVVCFTWYLNFSGSISVYLMWRGVFFNNALFQRPGPWFNIKMSSYQYRKSHCGGKTILPPTYLHNGISYTGKTTSLYWIRTIVLNLANIDSWNFCRYFEFPDAGIVSTHALDLACCHHGHRFGIILRRQWFCWCKSVSAVKYVAVNCFVLDINKVRPYWLECCSCSTQDNCFNSVNIVFADDLAVLGPRLNIKTVFSGRITTIKIRRSYI